VTLTDQLGCTYTSDYTLISPPELNIEFSTESPTCLGDQDGSIIVTNVAGGAGPFALSLNDQVLQTTSTFPVAIPSLSSGPQIVGVEDANGCLSEEEVDVPIPAEITVNLGPDLSIQLGEQVLLQAGLNFLDLASFAWTPASYLEHPDSLITLSTPINTIRYEIEVKDSSGCIARDEILVTVDKTKRVFIPNIITPDSDGFNDNITVFAGNEVARIRFMRIYDRWGEMLFENLNFLPNDPQSGWSGQARGQDVNPGVYIYAVEVEYVNRETEVITGDVTVIR
jgi:gliding motility-associated-like protein